MKPNLGPPYPPTWSGYPPQMSPLDRELWIRFRDQVPSMFQRVYFSVRVGDPILDAPGLEPEMQRVVDHVSRRIIDLVGEKDDAWWIIELRPKAAHGAIGSVLTYQTLWEEDPPDPRPVKVAIVSDYIDRNLVRVFKKFGILSILV